MAYTKSNEIMTRISLKYDSYANWTSKNPVLLKGEVAIATIPAGTTTTPSMTNLPNVVMKVGDGTSQYNDLKFVSGLAADVHDWAKAANKPSYGISEIVGALEYRLEVIDATTYKYELQSRKAGSSEAWAKVSDLDLSDIDARLDAVEADMTQAKKDIDAVEADMVAAKQDIVDLKAAVGDSGAVNGMINSAIAALDSTKTQAAGADGLALKVVQTDGVITEISGSIAANTYDAHGAAATAKSEAIADADGKLASAKSELEGKITKEAEDRAAAINALDYAGVEGTQAGTVVKFVDKISQADGVVSAELGELVFNSEYNAETNKAATMSDVTKAVADLNGAMHFEGVYETIPTDLSKFVAGDVIIVGKTEYVFSNGAFVELGDEGAIAAALSTLNQAEVGAADKTLKVKQENGKVTASEVAIQIAKSQVTGLETDLENLGKEDARLAGLIDGNTTAIGVINGEDAGKSMRTVAAEEAASAVNALDKTNAAQEGKYISAITQTDGLVTATYADLPVIPELGVTHATSVTTPTDSEVVVVGEIGVSGHNVTDTHVKVATMAGVVNAINALDADKNVSTAKHVMTGVTQENGVITSIDEVKMADIAFSGNVADLKQTENTYVVFNCGTSEINI